MAEKRKGQVVVSMLVTPTTDKKFAIVDSNDIRGGRFIVQTIAERNTLPASHRVAGQLVYVAETDSDYKLLPGFPTQAPLTDYNWEQYIIGQGGEAEEVQFEHNTVEEIEYGNQNRYHKLTDKLAEIDQTLDLKLDQHQTVEEIKYGTTYSGFDNLYDHLRNLTVNVNNIKNSSTTYIENINYQQVPVDGHSHRDNLADEIENIYAEMNNADKVMITNKGQRASAKTRIVNLENRLDDLKTTEVMTVLPLGAEGEPPKLSDKLNTIDSKIEAVSETANIAVSKTIEDFNYAEDATPEGHESNLKDELLKIYRDIASLEAQIDNANDIVLDTREGEDGEQVTVTLNDSLDEIKASITTLANNLHIEDVNYADEATPEGHQRNLKDELLKIYSDIASLSNTIGAPNDLVLGTTEGEDGEDVDVTLSDTIDNINSAIKAINDKFYIEYMNFETPVANHQNNLKQELVYIYSQLSSLASQIDNANDIVLDTREGEDGETIAITLDDTLDEIKASVTTLANNLHIEDVNYADEATPDGHQTNLKQELLYIYSQLNSLATQIDNANDIVLDTREGEDGETISVTLDDTLNSIKDSVTDLANNLHIEDVNYADEATPEGHQSNLKNELLYIYSQLNSLATQIDNANDIVLDTREGEDGEQIAVTLNDSLDEIKASITTLANNLHIEDVNYADEATPEGHRTNLKEELLYIYSQLNSLATQIDNANDIVLDTREGEDGETIAVTLDDTLDEIKSSVTTLADNLNIENVNYVEGQTPDGHQRNLKDELIKIYADIASLNSQIDNANDIVLDTREGEDGETVNITLDDTLDEIKASVTTLANNLHIEDVNYADNATPEGHQTNLKAELLKIYSDIAALSSTVGAPNDLVVGTKEVEGQQVDVTLEDTITEIKDSITSLAANLKVENITWNITPEGHQNSLSGELNHIVTDMNDPTKIKITNDDESTETLATKISNLTSTVSGLSLASEGFVQHVEDVSWTTTPEGHQGSLAGEINKLYTDISSINTTLSDMNDPSHIVVDATNNESLSTRLSSINTTLADMNDPTKINVDASTTLSAKLSALDSAIAGISVSPNDIEVSGHTNLATFATDTDNFIKNFERYYLFSTTAPSIGPLAGQEYLVTKASKIKVVSMYVDYEATLTENVVIKVQVAPTNSAYADAGTYTLATNAANKAATTTLATPISLAVGSRVRIYITSDNIASTINSFNVCLTVVDD